MNIQRILLSALLGATLVVTAACGTDAAQQAKSEVGKEVKVEIKMPSFDATPIADEYATIHTNKGDIKVRLYGSKAPITVKNFKSLIEQGYYNNLTFHRVIDGFMIQGGDNKKGGPGYTIPDEVSNDLHFNKMGILAMANAGPNTGNAQFFITVAPTPWLDNKHTIFGVVVQGMDVVEAISRVPRDKRDTPKEPVVIQSIDLAPIPAGE
ncbi:peptidylprolyl isomerase [Veillonella sp. VA137]|uniref:peptidylprolyl isomerase n=1 Tax=Veillonella sp. VA137 TaxID=741828 RepID=UPI000F8E80F7|nr:peptidylprolyl isomerase [Veillonella sp. VA137]